MRYYSAAIILLAIALLSSQPAEAGPRTSKLHNPYASFNVHGINYGAQQWEAQHRGQTSKATTTRGRWRRR